MGEGGGGQGVCGGWGGSSWKREEVKEKTLAKSAGASWPVSWQACACHVVTGGPLFELALCEGLVEQVWPHLHVCFFSFKLFPRFPKILIF